MLLPLLNCCNMKANYTSLCATNGHPVPEQPVCLVDQLVNFQRANIQ